MAVHLPRLQKHALTSSKCNVTLLDRLRGRRDILVPYFEYCRVLRGNRESVILRDIFSLRYDVYCAERAFVPSAAGDTGLETDAADSWAVHFGAYDRQQQIAATVRLVQPPPGQDYPFSQYCSPFPDVTLPPRAEAAEVSRLVVRKTYRRRSGDSMEGVPHAFAEHGKASAIWPAGGGARRRCDSPLLLLGLYRDMYRHSRETGIRFWYAAMDRPLARSLDRMGIPFRPISEQVDYFGPVALHMVDLDALDARLRQENRFLAAWFNGEPIAWWVKLRLLVQSARLGRARD
jgi:N-acyl amino acid synthase of PEP-CTERM/exosortase system